MASAIRITLSPIPRPAPGTNCGVSAVRVGLTQRGAGTTKAPQGTAKPAKITFYASLLKKARTPNDRVREPIGTVEGEIVMRSGDRGPEFVVTSTLPAIVATSVVPVGVTLRVLGLELDPACFRLSIPDHGQGLQLSLPETIANKDFNYLELDAELEIAGQVEAPLGTNDTLDVPLYPRPAFRIRLVDELNQSLSGILLDFEVNGKHLSVVTDASGNARVDDMAAASATVKIVAPEALRALLKTRWTSVRPGPYVNEVNNVLVLQSRDLDTGVMLTGQECLTVSIQPRVLQARVSGLLFDTNKSFLLPGAIPSMREVKATHDRIAPCKLLVVGHTDTSAEAWTNDPLSLDRAKAMIEFLTNQVDAWLARYKKSVAESHRWGTAEDLVMISTVTLAAGGSGVLDAKTIKLFQTTHNKLSAGRRSKLWSSLPEDGTLSADTRKQLVADYMWQEETNLPDALEITAHGCGEYFPLNATGEDIETGAADGEHDAVDRRVELFFFDDYCGVQPPPPAANSKKGSTQYPEWRRRARETQEYEVIGTGPLDIATFAPTDADVKLNILRSNGDVVSTLTCDYGQQTGNSLRFSMFPEALPNPTMFEIWRNGQIQHSSGPIDTVELRNALYVSDVDSAEFQLADAHSAGGQAQALQSRGGAVTRVTPPDPSAQIVRMAFTWPFANHRFLSGLTMSVTPLDGAAANTALAATAGSSNGKRSYDLPQDAKSVRVVLEVKSSLATIVRIEQKYTISRDAGRRPEVIPDGSNISRAFEHPRLRGLGFSTGSPGTAICNIPVDLLFLDVTEHVRKLPAKAAFDRKEYNGRFKQAEAALTAGGAKCRFRVLEYTGGHPSVWPVILPPDLQEKVDQGVLLFFKNEMPCRTDSDGVGVSSNTGCTNADDADYFYGLRRYWPSPSNVGKYIQTDPQSTLPYFHHYPDFGWEKQLRDSKRSVIVLFPIPHNVDFGVLDAPGNATPGLLRSALLCLFCDGSVKTGTVDPPGVRKLAVGGWSSGTDTLFKWVTAANVKDTKLRVDEFWIFDGKLGMKADVATWFTADPSRRLRLIGTAYTEVASNGLKSLGAGSGNVFVYPGNPKYWYEDPDYMSALAPAGSTAPFRFRHDPADAPLPFAQDASGRSNIFIRNGGSIADHGTHVGQSITFWSPGFGEHSISQMSHEEAAAFVVYEALEKFTGGGPVQDAIQFASICRWINSRTKADGDGEEVEPKISFRHRHPWSTFGGVFNYQGRPFVGYFQLCLEKSGL